ncbi:MAG TPA: bifunctional adenosylcobinamide kinase/adenosylcobinamide-phosphate guanylyltransferase [Ruminiclostridium sp.]|nr:bifunctional adenosylcobinamide kinase/adenosylcobinamide-phosphate guanylyltransferase [Ruminiclostridium sp.]
MVCQQECNEQSSKNGGIILITGGARSGKSTYAEKLAKGFGDNVLYIATAIPFDDEMKLRIKKHREQRPAYWETVEAYKDIDMVLAGKLQGRNAVLLDCITVMITNIMLEVWPDFDNISFDDINLFEEKVNIEMDRLIKTAQASKTPFILVTNETGMGIVPDNKSARVFRDVAGRVNQKLAGASDEVYFCVSGIPVKIK